jgi:hypothetical protein
MNWTDRDRTLMCMLGAFGLAIILVMIVYMRW